MNELTIQEIADRTGVDKTAAYALAQFLTKAGLANKGSGRKPEGKGKPVATYLMADTMVRSVTEMLEKLTASDGAPAKAAPEDHKFDDGTEGEEEMPEDEESDEETPDGDMTQASDQDEDEPK